MGQSARGDILCNYRIICVGKREEDDERHLTGKEGGEGGQAQISRCRIGFVSGLQYVHIYMG